MLALFDGLYGGCFFRRFLVLVLVVRIGGDVDKRVSFPVRRLRVFRFPVFLVEGLAASVALLMVLW